MHIVVFGTAFAQVQLISFHLQVFRLLMCADDNSVANVSGKSKAADRFILVMTAQQRASRTPWTNYHDITSIHE